MRGRVRRAAAAGLIGALLGTGALVLAYALDPHIVWDMSRDLPAVVSGIYPPERDDTGFTFAWTSGRAQWELRGLDRRAPWTMRLRVRGARPDPATLPDMTIDVDGVTRLRARSSNEFQTVEVGIPAAATNRGVSIVMTVSGTFQPGPDDARQLGVVLDEVVLSPDGLVLAPRRALAGAALGAAFMGAAFAFIGLATGAALGAAAFVAALQTLPIRLGAGAVSAYAGAIAIAAGGAALGTATIVLLIERRRRQPLRQTARFVAAFTAGAFYLKLLTLLHPETFIGDAMFHAHRFRQVIGGDLYFTSFAPGLYEFPYAVALYVFAAPFTVLTADVTQYVGLLRVVTTAADAVAGILLYVMITRAWGDRLAAAAAVGLYHLIPLNFNVLRVGNLTSVFGQALFIIAIAAVTAGPVHEGRRRWVLITAAAVTAAFLAHTSTFATLLGVLVAVAVLYSTLGSATLREIGRGLLVATLLATLAAVVLYYGHFMDVYRGQAERIASEMARPAAESDPGGRTVGMRAALVPYHVGLFLGWPAVGLAAAGAVRLWRRRTRDRLGLGLAGWLAACGAFLLLGVLTPLDFRHYLAAYPALAILGGVAVSRLWQRGTPGRLAATVLVGATVWLAGLEWLAPLQ